MNRIKSIGTLPRFYNGPEISLRLMDRFSQYLKIEMEAAKAWLGLKSNFAKKEPDRHYKYLDADDRDYKTPRDITALDKKIHALQTLSECVRQEIKDETNLTGAFIKAADTIGLSLYEKQIFEQKVAALPAITSDEDDDFTKRKNFYTRLTDLCEAFEQSMIDQGKTNALKNIFAEIGNYARTHQEKTVTIPGLSPG